MASKRTETCAFCLQDVAVYNSDGYPFKGPNHRITMGPRREYWFCSQACMDIHEVCALCTAFLPASREFNFQKWNDSGTKVSQVYYFCSEKCLKIQAKIFTDERCVACKGGTGNVVCERCVDQKTRMLTGVICGTCDSEYDSSFKIRFVEGDEKFFCERCHDVVEYYEFNREVIDRYLALMSNN